MILSMALTYVHKLHIRGTGWLILPKVKKKKVRCRCYCHFLAISLRGGMDMVAVEDGY